MNELPNKIFFTGAPGSKWSGISQLLEIMDGVNTTDRSPEREYYDDGFNNGDVRHAGAYFGPGMEHDAIPEEVHTLYTDPDAGCMLAKSHHWAYMLDSIKQYHCDDGWIMLVYRPDMVSFAWWLMVGGFKEITYPDYSWYGTTERMFYEIQVQNNAMLKFAYENKLVWESFTVEWCEKMFGAVPDDVMPIWDDVLVTMYKP